jgi:hypothetical protein
MYSAEDYDGLKKVGNLNWPYEPESEEHKLLRKNRLRGHVSGR